KSEDEQHTWDYVVSSYTPSLSALLRCSDMAENRSRLKPTMLLVTQPATPRSGLSPLKYVREESARLRALLPSQDNTFCEHDEARLETVLAAVRRHPWVHFACHGSQNLHDPTQSAFELFDGPLTLSALMGTVSENAELAFLSA
ncbi:CHAT domain-containing protein, partial [Chryseobacterium contaminans]|uniref:CHAT domain-containing protein n=1 Tax=Chryseobacterium contaminans TaxID=1423959 RepID=UPI000F4E1FCC